MTVQNKFCKEHLQQNPASCIHNNNNVHVCIVTVVNAYSHFFCCLPSFHLIKLTLLEHLPLSTWCGPCITCLHWLA